MRQVHEGVPIEAKLRRVPETGLEIDVHLSLLSPCQRQDPILTMTVRTLKRE